MDILKNKIYEQYSYTCRYLDTPQYFNTVDKREIMGLGSNMFKNSAYVSHKLVPTDTLDSLALTYYNNPTLWWVIAYFNDLVDSFENLQDLYTELKIPNLPSIEFGDER